MRLYAVVIMACAILVQTACSTNGRQEATTADTLDTPPSVKAIAPDTVDKKMPVEILDTAAQSDMPVVKPSTAVQPK